MDVELEGVEPSSKQGNHTLSTCLFQPLVFVRRQDLDHQPSPYPLKLHLPHEATADYSRFFLHRLTNPIRNNIQLSDVSSHHLVTGLSQ